MAALGALATPVIRRQPVVTAVAAGIAGAVAIASLLLWPIGRLELILFAVLFGGTYVIGVGAGVYLRDLERQQQAAAEAARVDERIDLARELHDLVAHYVTGIVVQAQAARVVADRDPAAAGEALDQIEGAGKDALTAMRRLVGSLRNDDGSSPTAPIAPPVGLAGLDDLVAASSTLGLAVALAVDQRARNHLPGAVAASTHRIVQESLTNVRRHAVEATRAEVDVRLVGEVLATGSTDTDTVSPACTNGPRRWAAPSPPGRSTLRATAGGCRPGSRSMPPPPGPPREPGDPGGWGDPVIRVVLADDQAMVRTGFKMILEASGDIDVVGEADNGRSAVALARHLRPDVCLLDIRMPELDGLEATRILAGPDVAEPLRVVVVTTFDLDDYVHTALLNGASGFLLEDAGPALLVEAVRAAARGDALVSPQVTGAAPPTRPRPSHAPGRGARAGRFAQRARGGGAAARRPRPHQRGDRRAAVRVAIAGEVAPGQPPDEARRPQPGGAGRVGLAVRAHGHPRLTPYGPCDRRPDRGASRAETQPGAPWPRPRGDRHHDVRLHLRGP